MPPKIRLRSLQQLAEVRALKHPFVCLRCQYATTNTTTAALSQSQMTTSMLPISRYPPSQPPSHRRPEYRKSQLLRSYVSLLKTTPLIILFQHNNLKAVEWVGIRRELAIALKKVDEQFVANDREEFAVGHAIKLQIIKPNIFEPALRIAEYYHPETPTDPPTSIPFEREDPSLTHALSEAAYQFALTKKNIHPLTTILAGPIALLNLPHVSPQHVKAALSILAPQLPVFPAPTRRANPSYHEPAVQDGLKKMMLLGARIDGEVFDMESTRWVGSIDGGIDGLRAQLVAVLQNFGAGLTDTLEAAGKSLWYTMDSRKTMLEQESLPKAEVSATKTDAETKAS